MEVEVVEGKTLFSCARCNSDTQQINRCKVNATEQEIQEVLDNVKSLAEALGKDVMDIVDEEVDFKRYIWSFMCEKCGVITKVRTEIDRY